MLNLPLSGTLELKIMLGNDLQIHEYEVYNKKGHKTWKTHENGRTVFQIQNPNTDRNIYYKMCRQ